MSNARRHNPPNPLQTARRFVRHYLGKYCFAPFTGQDSSAWCSFVYACELYGRTDNRPMCISGMEALLNSAQPKCATIFLWTIPAILDWHFADEIWPLVCGDVMTLSGEAADEIAAMHRRRDDDARREAQS